MTHSPPCLLLSLPVELRIYIFSYAILDHRNITIGTAKLHGSHPDVVHRLYARQSCPYPGIPQHHEPVIETSYRADLLSPLDPAIIGLEHAHLSDPPSSTGTAEHTRTPYSTLSLVNRQIKGELDMHFQNLTGRETSLFVQYPYGLQIMHSTTPQLLRQTRSIHLAGTYLQRIFCPRRAACVGASISREPAHDKLHGNVVPDSVGQLTTLFKSCFGPTPAHPIEKFEMRIFYPGENSYSTVWGDDASPIAIALCNIGPGEINMEIWRGTKGTGVYLTAKPAADSKRTVSSIWRKLEKVGNQEPKVGSWIVDPKWPLWAEYQTPPGPKGDTVV